MNLYRAKLLRKNQTEAEKLLWYHLRAHRLGGYKFRRQAPIDNYIVDFVCFNPKLIIELDGGQHLEQVSYDTYRSDILKSKGFKIIRFWNDIILKDVESVKETIYSKICELAQ